MAPAIAAIPVFTAVVAFTAAVWDVQTRRIPNRLSLPALVCLLLLQLCCNGLHALATASLAALIAGSIFSVFFLAGGMGGGDVKLIAAIAAGVGLRDVGALLVFTALVGGAMAAMLALRHGRMRQTMRNMHDLAVHHGHAGFSPHAEWHVQNPRALRLPYAVAIAAGAFLTLSLQGVQR
jgi:prepilin peptidase CpaA